MIEPGSAAELDALEERIDAWAAGELADNEVVAAVERAPRAEGRRWFIRVRGEEKDVFTIWLTLRQRTLHFETYVMPAPEERQAELYEHLLRRNQKLHGISFCIGIEEAVFLQGEVPVERVDEEVLDWALGSLYAATEQCFRPAMRIGFASRFGG
jgi:hypothetical protein